MNFIFQFMETTPLAYPYLICTIAALGAGFSILAYTRRTKRRLRLLSGPVPLLNQITAIRDFEAQVETLKIRAENAGCLGFLFGVVAAILFVYLCITEGGDQAKPLYYLGALLFLILVEFICGGEKYATQSNELLDNRPELACLKYVAHLPAISAENDSIERTASTDKKCEKIFWGSLDDFACAFKISAIDIQNRSVAPQDVEEARSLSDAQWRAVHDEQPFVGEPVLVIWRDSVKDKIKVLVSKVKNVEDASLDMLASRPGRVVITAASETFCGGKLAHFCGTPNEKIERGWIATADRAHVLLASLRWLDDDQRQLCFQLINPGKPFPTAADLSQV